MSRIDYSPTAVREREEAFYAEDEVRLQALRRREAQAMYANRGGVLTPRQARPFYNPTATQVAMNNEWPLRSVDSFGQSFSRALEGTKGEAFDGSRGFLDRPLEYSVCGRR